MSDFSRRTKQGDSLLRCPECGGEVRIDHCIEPGKRVGKIGCGWWRLCVDLPPRKLGPLRRADVWIRRFAEHFFGPMYEWRLTRWLIRRRGGNPADYEGLGKYRG